MDDRALIHSFETGRGKRIAVLLGALLVVAAVIWALASGLHRGNFKRSAAALTHTDDIPTQPVPRAPAR